MKRTIKIETASFFTRLHRRPCRQVLFAVGFFALCQMAQALTPAPDGGYPGANTAEGQNALASLDTSAGLYNTAVGTYSLLSLTNAKFCTAVGGATLLLNTADKTRLLARGRY